MKILSVLLGWIVISGVVYAYSQGDRISDLQMEIAVLNTHKKYLEKQICQEIHQEQREEVKSVDMMLSYHWTEFVSDMKNAEDHEKMNKFYESELKLINERISALIVELGKLTIQTD